jgi:hypothetical protein
MALLSHYRAAMAKTSSGELGGFDRVFKYLILFVQALIILLVMARAETLQ